MILQEKSRVRRKEEFDRNCCYPLAATVSGGEADRAGGPPASSRGFVTFLLAELETFLENLQVYFTIPGFERVFCDVFYNVNQKTPCRPTATASERRAPAVSACCRWCAGRSKSRSAALAKSLGPLHSHGPCQIEL